MSTTPSQGCRVSSRYWIEYMQGSPACKLESSHLWWPLICARKRELKLLCSWHPVLGSKLIFKGGRIKMFIYWTSRFQRGFAEAVPLTLKKFVAPYVAPQNGYHWFKMVGDKKKKAWIHREFKLLIRDDCYSAEEEGFEPPEPVKVLRFSRPVQ